MRKILVTLILHKTHDELKEKWNCDLITYLEEDPVWYEDHVMKVKASALMIVNKSQVYRSRNHTYLFLFELPMGLPEILRIGYST